jgi:hypothetical protein
LSANLENYLNTYGIRYIGNVGKSSEGVCCPEGFLDLPLDIWKCKLDKQTCKLQCPDCFIRLISIVKPDLLGELESLQLNFTHEPFKSSGPESLQQDSKKPSRDFVASLIELPDNSWCLGFALASLYGQDEFFLDFGDALTLAGEWLGLTDEEVTDICNDEDESKCDELLRTADLLCGVLAGFYCVVV